MRAAHCSDMLRMQELIDVGHQFFDALQILLDAEKSACETVNREVVELYYWRHYFTILQNMSKTEF